MKKSFFVSCLSWAAKSACGLENHGASSGENKSEEQECLLGLKSEDTDIAGSNEVWMKFTC